MRLSVEILMKNTQAKHSVRCVYQKWWKLLFSLSNWSEKKNEFNENFWKIDEEISSN